MRLMHDGAQRTSLGSDEFGTRRPSGHRGRRLTRLAPLGAALLGLAVLGFTPATASAASAQRVVVVVGPVESQTSRYIADGKALAAQARSYGASVTAIYSPNATWTKVKKALQGADLLIYLGHGNGWPSPYAPFRATSKDGLGLNASAGHGNSNVKYYGESYLISSIRMASHAVVILNHLCYSAGNSEPGRANPTKSVAKQRIGFTDDQMLRLEQSTQRFDVQRRTLAQQEKAQRVALRREILADSAANQSAIAASLDRLHDLQRQRLDLQTQEQSELATFMTPLQRAKFLALQEQVRKRMQELLRARPESGAAASPELP